MSFPKAFAPALLLLLLCALAAPSSAQASSTGDQIIIGWMAAAYSSIPLHTVSFVLLASKGTSSTPDDILFCNTLLLPFVGPAIAGTRLVESHPLSVLVCGVMWGLSILQTAGFVIAIAGHVRQHRHAHRGSRASPHKLVIFPALHPAGFGLTGIF